MPQVHDSWERLVNATLDREHLRELALAPSRETSISSSASAYRLNYAGNFRFKSALACVPELTINMDDVVIQIQLVGRLIRAADEAIIFRQECATIKNRAEILANLLRSTARASEELYSRPTSRIMYDAQGTLHKALGLVSKCRGGLRLKRVFTIISADSFDDIGFQLEHCISNFSWLLRDEDHLYRGVPPIASDEPVLYHVWELIAILCTGTYEDQLEALASLETLVQDDGVVYARLIVDEGGVPLSLKLIKPGVPLELQKNAAKLLGFIGKYWSDSYLDAGVCSTFAAILEEGPATLQPIVLWAVSEMTAHKIHEGHFKQHDIINLLIRHLQYCVAGVGNNNTKYVKDFETPNDPATEDYVIEMACRSLSYLVTIRRNVLKIAQGSTLSCLAILLERGTKAAQYCSATVLMRVTEYAEDLHYFRRKMFKPNSAIYKSLIDQLLRVIQHEEDSEFLVACIRAIGCLSRTFTANETRMINPLVKLLNGREDEVFEEACLALTKFARYDNYLSTAHSKAIVTAGGIEHLVENVYFGAKRLLQCRALVLLCCIAVNVPESEELARAEVAKVLEWASRKAFYTQYAHYDDVLLLEKATAKLRTVKFRDSGLM